MGFFFRSSTNAGFLETIKPVVQLRDDSTVVVVIDDGNSEIAFKLPPRTKVILVSRKKLLATRLRKYFSECDVRIKVLRRRGSGQLTDWSRVCLAVAPMVTTRWCIMLQSKLRAGPLSELFADRRWRFCAAASTTFSFIRITPAMRCLSHKTSERTNTLATTYETNDFSKRVKFEKCIRIAPPLVMLQSAYMRFCAGFPNSSVPAHLWQVAADVIGVSTEQFALEELNWVETPSDDP
jgi:hypothetical protein